MKKTVCVDLDGVLAEYHGWEGPDHFGEPIPGAKAFLRALRTKYEVVILTSRVNVANGLVSDRSVAVQRVRDWLTKWGFDYDELWIGKGKPIAIAYIDDRAIKCVPQQNPSAFGAVLRELELPCLTG